MDTNDASEPAADTNPMQWWYGRGMDPEAYKGPYPTKENAIAMGKAEAWPEQEGFTIVEANSQELNVGIFDAGDMFERLEEYNDTCWGDDGMELNSNGEQQRELEAALTATFTQWLDRHKLWPHVWAFDRMQNQQYFEPPNQDTEVKV